MSSQILGWTDAVMDTAEVVALGAVLWLLFRVDGKIAAMLRVIRRIDRKTAEPTKSLHRQLTFPRPAQKPWPVCGV